MQQLSEKYLATTKTSSGSERYINIKKMSQRATVFRYRNKIQLGIKIKILYLYLSFSLRLRLLFYVTLYASVWFLFLSHFGFMRK